MPIHVDVRGTSGNVSTCTKLKYYGSAQDELPGEHQTKHAEPVLVSLLVLLETEWVLRSRYELAKPEILSAFSALLDASDLAFEDEPSIEHALYSWKDSVVDFADCLVEARNRRLGCEATATFDSRALKLAGFACV